MIGAETVTISKTGVLSVSPTLSKKIPGNNRYSIEKSLNKIVLSLSNDGSRAITRVKIDDPWPYMRSFIGKSTLKILGIPDGIEKSSAKFIDSQIIITVSGLKNSPEYRKKIVEKWLLIKKEYDITGDKKIGQSAFCNRNGISSYNLKGWISEYQKKSIQIKSVKARVMISVENFKFVSDQSGKLFSKKLNKLLDGLREE